MELSDSRTVAVDVQPLLLADVIGHVLRGAGFLVVSIDEDHVDLTITSGSLVSSISGRPLIRLDRSRQGPLMGVVRVDERDELVRVDTPWDLVHLAQRLCGG